ncbi:uncharacterized protein LODBEIA_P17350 [Lodderomyces beijingensis]|uniref:HMG box domain-containing protein n=1 Tax=Lodderomyces beijingensis TaxID=1775926 RepID=A0ABP0ZH71_9ASCO
MSDFKNAKDALISSLFELSKASSEAANSAVNFYRVVTGGEEDVTSEQLHDIQEAMKAAVKATSGVKHELESANGSGSGSAGAGAGAGAGGEKTKKRKVTKDPNAPKKPLTMFFAFSFNLRKQIGDERKNKNLPNLSAIDMNQMIKDRWDNITPQEKEKWKHKYDEEMKEYLVEKGKYEQSKIDGTDYKAPPAPYADGHKSPDDMKPKVTEVDDEEEEEDTTAVIEEPSREEKEKEKKRKKEKKEKKEKKKKLISSS